MKANGNSYDSTQIHTWIWGLSSLAVMRTHELLLVGGGGGRAMSAKRENTERLKLPQRPYFKPKENQIVLPVILKSYSTLKATYFHSKEMKGLFSS